MSEILAHQPETHRLFLVVLNPWISYLRLEELRYGPGLLGHPPFNHDCPLANAFSSSLYYFNFRVWPKLLILPCMPFDPTLMGEFCARLKGSD